ncbi:MAG: hypothetical protein Q9159_002292 [Coniocarpon cinnabarinum]
MSSSKARKPGTKGAKSRSAIHDQVAREYTIHLHKRVYGVQFKKRAPRAIKEVRKFATKAMVRPLFPITRKHARPRKQNSFFRTHSSVKQRTNVFKGTNDVRLDPQLNKKVWESGVKGVPHRLRVRISRRRNDEEGAKERLYSYVQAVNVKSAKGLSTTVVENEE